MPMMSRFQLSLGGDVQFDRVLLRWADHVEDARPLWRNLNKYLVDLEKRQFKSEGTHHGWQELAPSTVARKARLRQRPEILRATDELLKSMTSIGGTGHAVRHIEHHQFTFGTTVKYAGMHQRGGGRLPQRRVIDLSEHERVEIVKRMQRFIVHGDPMAHK